MRDLAHGIAQSVDPFGAVDVVAYGSVKAAGRILWGSHWREEGDRVDLEIRPVASYPEVMQLRALRNECAPHMTGYTDQLTQAQQILWWQCVANDPDWRVWLAYAKTQAPAIGYLLLRRVPERGGERRLYVSLGVTAAERGKGYGAVLYLLAQSAARPEAVWAKIRPDNEASIAAALSAGFDRAGTDEFGNVVLVGEGERAGEDGER